MKDFQQLVVWQKAHQLTLMIYTVTKNFPKEEVYGLTAQIRRASLSIGSNLAEGCSRDSDADLGRFVTIAAGSAAETQYQLMLANDLDYLPKSDFEKLMPLVSEVRKMLSSFLTRLKANR